MNYCAANLIFDWDGSRIISNLTINGHDCENLFRQLLPNIDKNQGHPYSLRKRFLFDRRIEELCEEFFEGIKEIQTTTDDNIVTAYLASYLYERFAGYWKNELLLHGLYVTGVSFWQEIISITKEWESRNRPMTIHKGTPFFFLSHNCLINGDRDNGFTYLYNALEDDKKLHGINYPQDAPAYLTATMSDRPRNFMYPQVSSLQLFLEKYISKFRTISSISFTMNDFKTKFLENLNLADTVAFFVYNLQFIHDQEKNTNYSIMQNDFSRLKILDLFFNFGLIIDKILTNAASIHGRTVIDMKASVQWWAETKFSISQVTFDNLIGTHGLNLNHTEPDLILPTLISNINNPSQYPRDLYFMLIAYRLRNYAGHNLTQQTVLSLRYNEVLECLFFALFIAIDSI